MKNIYILILMFLPAFSSGQDISNLPLPMCSGAAEVLGDSVYFFGGSNRWAGTIRYQTVFKYNGNDWSYYDSIPDNNVWGITSTIVDSNVYLLAGWPNGMRYNRRYNLLSRTWSYLQESPNVVPYGVTSEQLGNKIYLFNTSGSVFEYDIASDTWQIKTQNSTPGYSLSSVVYQNEIYINGYYDSLFYKYSPALDLWTKLSDLPFKVVKGAMQVVDNKIYLAGGSEQGNPPEQSNKLIYYDAALDEWFVDQFEMQSSRLWMADIIYKEKFYVLGGFDSTGFAVNIVEEITPIGAVSSISETEYQPEEFKLYQNYPNPFNPNTRISWHSPASGWQTLKIFDVLGNEVATLVNEFRPAGTYEIEFNSESIIKHPASGIYFYRLQTGSFVVTKKMLLIK